MKLEQNTVNNVVIKRTQQRLVKFSKVFSLSEQGFRDGKFKILFGSLKMDDFPQTEDGIQLQDLKSMTLER